MQQYIIKDVMSNLLLPDLPDWVDDITEPFWTKNIIRHYEKDFIIPKKTYNEFIILLHSLLDIEETEPYIKLEGSNLIQYKKVWKVLCNEKSKIYNQYLKWLIENLNQRQSASL